MPRGRPPKNKNNNVNKNLTMDTDGMNCPAKKKKYQRKKKQENGKKEKGKKEKENLEHPSLPFSDPILDPLFDHLGNSIKIEGKKRGRKRGRKKKEDEIKPEDVIDYMIRNFPRMGIEKIKDRVLNGLKTKKLMDETPYTLDKILHNGIYYYQDAYGTILNADGIIVGYSVKNDDESESKYMIDLDKKDTRSYQEVIDHIESMK